MSKVKLTTVSGTIVEKPIITCFNGTNGTYLILDNETNGTMGLPIILVSKIFNDKAIKIIDQGEWQSVKEYLKSIIAGKPIELAHVKNELSADDVYYTQLTLPVNSFETLKKSYEGFNNDVVVESTPVVPIVETPVVAPVTPVVETPVVAPVTSVQVPEITSLPVEEPVNNSVIMPEVPTIQPLESPEVSTPSIDPVIDVPVENNVQTPDISTIEQVIPEINVVPEIPSVPTEEPVFSSAVENKPKGEYDDIKATFMAACENMFDALVIKFQNKK